MINQWDHCIEALVFSQVDMEWNVQHKLSTILGIKNIFSSFRVTIDLFFNHWLKKWHLILPKNKFGSFGVKTHYLAEVSFRHFEILQIESRRCTGCHDKYHRSWNMSRLDFHFFHEDWCHIKWLHIFSHFFSQFFRRSMIGLSTRQVVSFGLRTISKSSQKADVSSLSASRVEKAPK